MKLDLSALQSGSSHQIDFEYSIDLLSKISDDDFAALPADVVPTAPLEVRGIVSDHSGYMRLEADVKVSYRAVCARCARDVDGVFSLSVSHVVAAEEAIFGEGEESDDYFIIRGGMLDIDARVAEELALEFPSKILCSEDCLGLCSGCGRPLSVGECGCASKKEINPALAVLQKLLDK